MLLPSLSLLAVAIWVVRRSWPVAKTLARGRKVLWCTGVVLVQAALVLGALAAGLLTQPNWLFGPPAPFLTLASPNRARTAFATRDCFLSCSLEVHVQEGNSLTMQRIQKFSNVESTAANIRWLPDSSNVEVSGVHPQAGPLLDWGPH